MTAYPIAQALRQLGKCCDLILLLFAFYLVFSGHWLGFVIAAAEAAATIWTRRRTRRKAGSA